MIEIGGFIHEFDVGKTQEKSDDGNSIFITKSYEKCRKTTYYKK